MDLNAVYDVLKDARNNWPKAPAIYDELGMMTFEELYLETEALKNQLVNLGVREGMGIGVMDKNGRHFIIGIFAVIGCGAVVMPMSHQLKQAEIDEMLNEAQLHGLLFEQKMADSFSQQAIPLTLKNGSFCFSYTGYEISNLFAPHVKQAAFMRYTSGTTGKSKGVIISHSSAIERVDSANKILKLGPTDVVVWVLPMAYHFIVSILLYIRVGAAIVIVKDFLAPHIIEMTNRYKGTMLYASPMQIKLLAANRDPVNLDSLRLVISTSTAIHLEDCIAFKKRYGLDVSQAYGIIEIGLPILNHYHPEAHPDSVGKALPDYQVDILDEDFQPVADGEIGQLGIKGPGMFDAYLSPPILREEVLKNGYFITADYAVKNADGIITIAGRKKSMINVSGNKVFPEEIESILESIKEISQARVSGAAHPLFGTILQAELILHDGCSIDIEAVLTYCRKRLSSFKVPQRVHIVDSLPMTGSGKLSRAL